MDGTLIEMLMSHEIGQQITTYLNMPLGDLREIYASYEHLLTIEKTSKDEQSKQDIPEVAMKKIRDQGQKIAELETKVLNAVSKIESIEEMLDKLIPNEEQFIESQRK